MKEENKMLFAKTNYYIMAAGVLLVVIGFMLMSGGKAEAADVFNEEEIFSGRRITLAPITVLLGYIVVGYGILKKSE